VRQADQVVQHASMRGHAPYTMQTGQGPGVDRGWCSRLPRYWGLAGTALTRRFVAGSLPRTPPQPSCCAPGGWTSWSRSAPRSGSTFQAGGHPDVEHPVFQTCWPSSTRTREPAGAPGDPTGSTYPGSSRRCRARRSRPVGGSRRPAGQLHRPAELSLRPPRRPGAEEGRVTGRARALNMDPDLHPG